MVSTHLGLIDSANKILAETQAVLRRETKSSSLGGGIDGKGKNRYGSFWGESS